MSTYDDIIEQNKRSLTQAQIEALAQAAQQYSIENAGNRAGALASARQQYDTGYRGLQNMGLAGANGAQPTSGEVPRLKTEIQTPFDQYNQRLKSVERQRVAALSGNMVYQNQLAAEEARRRALAEEEARRQAAARETDQARFQRAQAVANAINRNRTFGQVTAADLSVPSRKEYEASTTPPEVQAFNQASVKAANAVTGVANTFPSVMVRAAAAMVGLQDPYSAINTAQQNEQLGAVKDAYQKADATLRGMDQTRKYGGTVDEKQYQATKRTRDEAKAVYDAEKSRREADTYRREAEKIQQQDPEYYDAIVTANNAKATPDAKKRASVVLADRAAKETVSAMGIQKTMTDADYDKLSKVIPDVRRALNVIDSQRQVQEQKKKTGTTGADYEQRDIDEQLAELKKLGYTEEEARHLIKSYDDERQVKMEYSYWQPAYSALYAHQGEKPTGTVNRDEKDYTYRIVNGLKANAPMGTMGDALMSIWRDDKKIIGEDTTKYMTDAQRDAYNAIYEKEGVKAANEYIKEILPLVEMQRAEKDQKWLEQLATEKGFPAWLLARGTNLIGSVPAMVEKLGVGAVNLINEVRTGGTNEILRYSPNSAASRLSNWADIVQSSQAQRILEKHDNSIWGNVLSFAYQTGTSMADSLIAMGLSGVLGEGATYALFFSSAGNQAYKDTIARGGTQGQAMAMSILSGAAEAVFEEVSLEQLTKTLKFGGKPFAQIVKQALVQAGVEGSEEFFTSVANMLSDMMVMGDKAEIDQAIKNNSLGKYLWDNLGMDTIGGFVSGLGFGAASMAGYGASKGINAVADYKNKKALGGAVRENTAKMQEIKNTAILLGGETAETVQAVDKKATNTNVADMTVAVADDIRSLEEKGPDTQAATLALIEGAEMDLQQASDVRSILGEEELTKRGYNASSDEAFQKSYNDKVTSNDMTSRSELQQQSQRQAAAERVWANPEQGLALTSEDGRTVRPMPGNMTAVAKAEQERTGFKTRTTATNGKVTYAISGMEARQGMTNEQIYNEIQNGLTKEARQKAQRYEKLANALGLKMVIHDVMTGTNGFIDSDGNMHVVLSGRQTVLRVASHELTHHMKEHNATEYASLRDHLIKEVGQEKFDDMVKKKAKQYGLDLNTEKGKVEADDEVCAELCERMLSSEEAIERFAEKDTAAAKTLKDRLLKILNAIRAALKDEKFGKNSALIKDQETIETWLSGVTHAIENAEARAQTNEGQIAQVAGVTSVDQEEMLDEIHEIEMAAEKEEIQVTEETKAEAKEETAQETKEESKEAKDQPGRLAVAAVRRQIELLKKTPGNEAKIADLEQKLANFEAKKQEKIDDTINRYCVDVTEYDMEGYARDLFNAGFSQDEITVLFDTMTKAIEQVKLHRALLDFGPMLSEEAQNNPELAAKEIKEMKEGRAYLPYKQNADPHYKLALDFSTLCRKRILLQTIQERLQAKLGRALSQEETVAIRLELQNLQKNNKEEFGKIEVACALCYVEAARLKSPKVINAFLNNTKAEMQNYFAKKNPATKEIIERKQQEWKVEHKYAPDATKKQMSSSDVTAFDTYSRELREQFESDSAAEQATVDRATRLTKGETVQIGGIKFPGRETFLSASWLEKLKGVEPDIFYAFTDKVRSATRSKAQETDTFYARRDIDMVTEGILGYANAESGFRHQSWSDFVTIHLLDTMASVIEMSTRQAKMHAYTKVPAMVRFLGKTGMMLNMSLIPAGQTGLKLDGTLDFDSVEGMAWDTMKELRDMFPETAGNIAIGINDAQIRELLMSPDIDYVIPYHASGMNKNMRGYMDIKSWAEYTSSQNEKSNHRGAKGKSPELAEWFGEKEAAKAEDGYAFMRAASEKYLQLCAERNLIPKFSQYLTNNGDGSYSLNDDYANYWKLLIDRKMVNQVTGKVILQQAVKPTFDQDTVLGLLEDRITDPTVQQQAKAADLVTEKFGDWQANKNNASAEAIAEAKKIRDRSNAITAQKTAEGTMFDLDLDEDESPRSLAELVTRYSLDETPSNRKEKATAKETGYKPAGKEPRARDVKVPEVAKNGKRVSDFTRSFLESNKATDEIASELLGKVESGEWGGYTRLTNDEAMERAKNYIAKRQVVAAQQDFHDMVMSGKYNVNTRALGLQLLTEAAQRGDKVALLDIASDLRVLATDAGQSVQIFSVLKDLGGVGSAWYLNKVVERLNTKYADQIADGKMNEITVPEELMTQLEQAQTTQDVTAAEQAIAKNIADQLPLTWADRLSNWRYMAMLANPTTHVRNMFGNLLMGGMNTAKDVVATGIERIGVKDQSKRTHAVITAKDRKAWNGFAEQSYKDNEGLLRGNGKFSFESEIKQNMRSFDTKALNAIAQFNFNKLEQEDMAFIRPAFKNALMQYMKAQGYTIQNGVAGKTVNGEFKAITKAQMAQAVEYASEQAWKATFHDASALASMLNKISNMNAASRLIVEGVLPFKKTPINIAKRGVEYSPAGIVMGTVQLMRDVKKGKVTTAHAIDNLASGITGTALMVVGMFLSKLGVIKAEGDDDKKKATYLQDTGDQTYSLKIGKYSFSLSALAPATIPLFMGAALQEKISGTGDLDLSTVTDVISGALNPFMEMSFMSSLNSALKNYGNEGIGGALGNTVLTSAENYFSQYLPTVTSKLGQLADPTLRTTKSSATSPIGSGMDYYVRSLAKKVPGLEATLEPDVNVWGRQTKKDSFGKWALDFANKFILPTNLKVSNRDAVDDELIRLVESTGETGILPSDGPKYFTVNGEKYSMNAKQYTEYSQDRGIASYAAIKETMNSAAYQQASDTEKESMLTNALTAAQKQVNTVWKEKLGAFDKSAIKNTASAVKATAKGQTVSEVKDIQGDYSDPALYKVAAQYPNAYDKAAKAKSQGVAPDTFLSLYEKKDTYIGENRSDYVRQEIMNSNLTPKQKELMDDLLVSEKGRNPDYSSQTWFEISMLGESQYTKAKNGEKIGVKPDVYLAAYKKSKTISAKDENGKTVNGLKKKRAVEYLDTLNVSAPVYDYLLANIFGYTTR